MFALMGIQSSPAFTLWNFGMANPKALAWQQVFMSTFVVGICLFFFTAFQGMGARILQMAGEIVPKVDSDVVPMLMVKFLPGPVLGIVFLGAIAAIHSTAAPYIGTGGTIIQMDFWWRYVKKQQGSHKEQIWTNRIFATLLSVAAVVVSLTSTDTIVMIGGFATAFGTIMYLALMGVHWGFKFPSIGVVLGLISAIVVCFITYYILSISAVHPHGRLGNLHGPWRGLSVPGAGVQRFRRDNSPAKGSQAMAEQHRRTL